jgi:hypothetical protein
MMASDLVGRASLPDRTRVRKLGDVQLVQRWWNGRFGRLARRDIWLEQDTTWQVRSRKGDGASPATTWRFESAQTPLP